MNKLLTILGILVLSSTVACAANAGDVEEETTVAPAVVDDAQGDDVSGDPKAEPKTEPKGPAKDGDGVKPNGICWGGNCPTPLSTGGAGSWI